MLLGGASGLAPDVNTYQLASLRLECVVIKLPINSRSMKSKLE